MRTFFAFLALVVTSVYCMAAHSGPVIGVLPIEQCSQGEDQRFWFPRMPPYVGYSNGEKTTAGGDGTCYLGFLKENDKSAVMLIDGQRVKLIPRKSRKPKVIAAYVSMDTRVAVEVRFVSEDTTCEPGVDKCCGTYTYALISVVKDGKTASVRAAGYSGS